MVGLLSFYVILGMSEKYTLKYKSLSAVYVRTHSLNNSVSLFVILYYLCVKYTEFMEYLDIKTSFKDTPLESNRGSIGGSGALSTIFT